MRTSFGKHLKKQAGFLEMDVETPQVSFVSTSFPSLGRQARQEKENLEVGSLESRNRKQKTTTGGYFVEFFF